MVGRRLSAVKREDDESRDGGETNFPESKRSRLDTFVSDGRGKTFFARDAQWFPKSRGSTIVGFQKKRRFSRRPRQSAGLPHVYAFL